MIVKIIDNKFYTENNEEISYLQIPKPSDFYLGTEKVYTSGSRGRIPNIITNIINGIVSNNKNKVEKSSFNYTPKNSYEFFIFEDRAELHINGTLYPLNEKSLLDIDLYEFVYGVFPAVIKTFTPYIKDFMKVPQVFKYSDRVKPAIHENGNKILMSYNAFSFIHLLLFYKKVVTQEAIVEFISKYTDSNDPCQLYRHFDGLFVLQNDNNEFKKYGYKEKYTPGSYILWSITERKPINMVNRDILEDEVWKEIKEKYNYTCQLCGSKEGEPHNLNISSITKLEKGHVVPHLPLSVNNCVPHCHICNKQMKNDYYLENYDNGYPTIFINYAYFKTKYGNDKCEALKSLLDTL